MRADYDPLNFRDLLYKKHNRSLNDESLLVFKNLKLVKNVYFNLPKHMSCKI